MQEKTMQLQKVQDCHYMFIGFVNFDQVLSTLKKNLPYYRISSQGKVKEKEIFYDVQNGLLSDFGITLSKLFIGDKVCFHVTRASRNKNIPVKRFLLDSCEPNDKPGDFAQQISAAIENSFLTSPFTIDLVGFVRKSFPIIEVNNDYERFEIVCGSGYRASMLYETTTYKDANSKNKITRTGITFKFPLGEYKETEEIKNLIQRKIKGIYPYNETRFNIGYKMLFSEPQEFVDEPMDEE